MKFIIPIESICQKKGGVIIYDPEKNKILEQYVHNKKWEYRVGWRGGILYNDYLIATDWTDIHYFNHSKWQYEKTFKKDTFNDLHYLNIKDDQLFVVNTGLDTVEIFNDPLNPKFIGHVRVFKRNKKIFRQRTFDLKEKYNERFKIKPHAAHPNSICFDEKRIYITCFEKDGRINSGEIMTLSGKRITRSGYSCHDSHVYNGDFYTTQTRQARILVFNDIANRKIPIAKPDRQIPIKKKGWWRGCVLHDGKAYIFASKYTNKKETAVMCTLDLKSGNSRFRRLPAVDGIHWDTVYQPNLFEK